MTLDDDGFMTVVDRKKELIKYKGLQGMRVRVASQQKYLTVEYSTISLDSCAR